MSARSHAADPIAELMQEHNDALLQLKRLNKSVQAVRENGYTSRSYRQIQQALRFIREEVSVHNRKEETALFPVLERYVVGPTKVMRDDHKKLKKGFVKLHGAVAKLSRKHDSFGAIRELSAVSKDVVQLFVNHIHKENYILFPLVRQFLEKDELREIARRML